MAIESYKNKSRIATAIGGICKVISILGVQQLTEIFPEYGKWIPAIVALATWYISQSTEEKRVSIAEQRVEEKYNVNDPTTPEHLNMDYEVVEDDT